jgi:hypothetical protein
VHAHVVLMLAATALIAMFVLIVVAVTMLERRGRLGEPARRIGFASYGPILAAACSGGAAAVHLAVAGEHVALSAADGSPSALALLCSIGAGATHLSGNLTAANPSLAGFLPLGVLSLGMIGAQGALVVPRLWRQRRLVLLGLGITLGALAVAVLTRLLAPSVAGTQQVPYSDALAVVFDVALVAVAGLLAIGRPQRLVERLRVSPMDAWVGTGLGVAAVGVFTVAGYLLAHATH